MILNLKEAEKYASEHPQAEFIHVEDGYFEVKQDDEVDKMEEHQYDIVDTGEGIPNAVKGYLEEETKYGIRQDGEGRLVIENLDIDKTLEGRIDGW